MATKVAKAKAPPPMTDQGAYSHSILLMGLTNLFRQKYSSVTQVCRVTFRLSLARYQSLKLKLKSIGNAASVILALILTVLLQPCS
jgi:hypothetical protein